MSLDSGLVAYYTMDELSGNLTDQSGNGNTGTATGTTSVDGVVGRGKGRSFNGSSDYIELGTPASLQLTGAITVTAWVKWDAAATANDRVVSKYASTPDFGWELRIDDNPNGQLGFMVSGTGTDTFLAEQSAVFTKSQWIHIAGTYVPSTSVNIYRDGLLISTNTTSIPATQYNQSATPVRIGRKGDNTAGLFFFGLMDDVRIYNRALSATEINQLALFGVKSFVKNMRPRSFAPGLAR